MRRQTEKTTSSARTPSLAEIESSYVCLMLRDSRQEDGEGNSCKPHIMRPSRVRPSARSPPEPLRFLRADVITLVRERTDGWRSADQKGRRARIEREREERREGEMKGVTE